MTATNKSKPAPQETEPQVIALKSKKDSESKETRITLFSIDGKDYSIPAKIRPNQALQIMNVMRKQGETAGVSCMLEVLLGTEGYDALIGFDDLEQEDLRKIIKIGFAIVAGATENPKAA